MTFLESIGSGLILTALGIYSLSGALSNRDGFFRGRKLKALDELAGRKAARIICGGFGAVLTFLGIMVMIFPE